MSDTYLDGNNLFVDYDGMQGKRAVVTTAADTLTLADSQSNSVVFATKGSATQTFTLPAATTAGRQYTFVCNHASGEILINPATSEKIRGQVLSAVSSIAAGAISNTTTGIKNTAATNVVGDSITLLSDGVDTWHIIASTGVWASQ